jgi:hypothetical protein
MVEKCANPECSKHFDYRQGRLYCCRTQPSDCGVPTNSHGVEHYWLCGPCSETHTFERLAEFGVVVILRVGISPAGQLKWEPPTSRAA